MRVGRRQIRCCAICGSTQNLQEHHLGGFHHAPFFTIPLCEHHHQAVHIAITRSGVNLEYTSIRERRACMARMAAMVFLWFLDEQLLAAEQP